jgi:hypothetical protein
LQHIATEEERKEVHKWRDAKDGSHNWDLFFQYVINTLEHREDAKGFA